MRRDRRLRDHLQGERANKCFWEDDRNTMYGGISWTDHNITQIWYPSNDYFSSRGTLTGAYNFGKNAEFIPLTVLDTVQVPDSVALTQGIN